MKEIDELPVKIQERMQECRVEQGNPQNSGLFRRGICGGFYWYETKEGHDTWYEALVNDDYEPLYAVNPELRPDEIREEEKK